VVTFNRLSPESIEKIVQLQLRELAERLREQGWSLDVSPEAVAFLAEKGYDPAFGARPVKRAIRQWVEDPLSVRLIAGDFKEAAGVRVLRNAEEEGLHFEVIAAADAPTESEVEAT